MSRKVMTESEFNAIKILIKNGAPSIECKKYFMISDATYYRIKSAENWTEYKNIIAAMAVKKKEKEKKEAEKKAEESRDEKITEMKEDLKPIPTVTQISSNMAGNYQYNRMIEEIRKQNELLTLISAKLAFIVEALA